MQSSHSQHGQPEPKKLMIDFEPGFSLRDALNVLFCHKWKIILFFCTVVSSISVSTYRMPYFYSSEAKIVINPGRDPNTIAPILGPSQFLSQNQQEKVNNEVLILKSRLLAEKVVNAIGEEQFFKKRVKSSDQKPTENIPKIAEQPTSHPSEEKQKEISKENSPELLKKTDQTKEANIINKPKNKDMWNAAVNRVKEGLSVELKPLSFVVGLTVTVQDPVLAQKILETLIEEYKENYIRMAEAKSVSVFKERFEEYGKKLRETEDALHQFKVKHNIVSLEGQIGMLIVRVGDLMGQTVGAESRIVGLKTKVDDLKKLLPNYEKLIISQTVKGKTNNLVDALKNLLIKLQTQEIELSSRYPDSSRKVIEIKQQIELVENIMMDEPETLSEMTESLNQNYEHFSRQLEESKIELKSNEISLTTMKNSMNDYQQKLDYLLSHELELKRLERDKEIFLKEYQVQLDILKKAENYKALNENKIISVDTIEPPTFSDDAVKPNKPKNIILGIVLGLFGGIGLAFFLDYFDDSMKTNEDVKRHLKLPVLAMITTNEFERLRKG